jgi:hypothetical protein
MLLITAFTSIFIAVGALANLTGVNLTGTIYSKTTMPDGTKKQFRLLTNESYLKKVPYKFTRQ